VLKIERATVALPWMSAPWEGSTKPRSDTPTPPSLKTTGVVHEVSGGDCRIGHRENPDLGVKEGSE
jgi:hypothetical protein